MKFNLGHILNRIRPKTQWVVTDEKISRWDSEEPEPTLEELEAGRKELEDEWKASEYKRLRKKEYPEIGDQLDALYHAGLFPKEMADKLKAVKEKNPKPVVKKPKPELKDGN
jgi:hypothetical protein